MRAVLRSGSRVGGTGPSWALATSFRKLEAWKEVLRAGYEGLVAKDPESPYVPGRTLKRLKVKQPKVPRGGEGGFYRP